MLSPGASVDVAPGGDLQGGIAYGNHPSSESHTGPIRAKIIQDAVNGRAVAFMRSSFSDIRCLRVSSLCAVEGRKQCIIHDLVFAGDGYRSSVNGDAEISAAPPCELGSSSGMCVDVQHVKCPVNADRSFSVVVLS